MRDMKPELPNWVYFSAASALIAQLQTHLTTQLSGEFQAKGEPHLATFMVGTQVHLKGNAILSNVTHSLILRPIVC